MIPQDKANHFIAGVLLYAAGHFLNPVIGIWLAVAYGAGKEIYDAFNRDRHTPDLWDFVWTVGGGVVGYICGVTPN